MARLVDIDVDTTEVEVAIRSLDKPLQPMLQVVGEVVQSDIDDLIQSEGSSGVKGPWQPFSSVTYKLHPRRIGGKLLQDTGLLANFQITHGRDWVQVGSPAPYAGYQFQGILDNAMPNVGPVPARDALAIDLDKALREASGLVAEEIIRV